MVSKSYLMRAALVAAIVALVTVGLAAQRPVNSGKSNQARGRAVQAEKKGITEAQRANVRDRIALATRIVDRHEAEAKSLGLEPEWRRARLDTLLPLSLDSLRAVESAPNLEALSAAVTAELVEPQSLGSTTEDLVYKPITPCRYIDTRFAGGKISGYRGYDLWLNGSNYGGVAACSPVTLFGVGENSFGALAMNVLVLEPSVAPGWLTVKPAQSSDVSTLVAWATLNVRAANQGILSIDQTGANEEFWIQASVPTHVIVDISGAFIAPQATALDTVIVEQEETCANGATCSITTVCDAGYRLTGGGASVLAYTAGFNIIWDGPAYGASDNSQEWLCQALNN